MGFRHPLHGVAQRGRLAGVDRDAGAAGVELQRLHVIDAPLAADHDRQPRAEAGIVVQHPAHLGALVVLQQFEVAVDGIGDASALGGPNIGRIGVTQIALDALGPYRPGRGGSEIAQQFGLFLQRPVAEIGFREFPAQSAEFANPHNGLAADGAAHGFDGAAVRGGEIEQKAFAGLAQGIDGMVHLQRRFRRQPGSEGEDALRRIQQRVLRDQQRGVAADLGPVVARGPGDQDLGFGEQQRAQPVGLNLQVGDVGAEAELGSGRPDAGPHQEDCGHDGKAEQGERRRQRREFLMIEVEPGRNRLRDGQIAGKRGFRQRGQGGGERNQAVARQ